MSTNTITTLPYSGTTQVATVTSTYGIPVTAHIWGAGGGSSSAHEGAGGGYSQVQFVANPGDILTVAVGQGGGAGGVTAPPPAPPTTWSTRSDGCTTTLYPGYQYPQSFYVIPVTIVNTYGVWNIPSPPGRDGGGTFTWPSVLFPVSGYYTIQGQSFQNNSSLNIDNVSVLSGGPGINSNVSTNVYVTAGYHRIDVSATYLPPSRTGFGPASVGYVINQTNPPKITTTPTGLPGASYIGLLFNSRFPPPGQDAPVFALGNGNSFLDQWGVWGPDQNDISFTRTYIINFPTTADVVFQMASSMIATLSLDGNTILTSSPALPWETGVREAFVDVTGGTHTISFSGTGSVGALNRIGVIFGTGDQTSYSGGRGGISEPSSTQGFGGGGGGATVLSLNGVVIGIGAGGGGGATMDPSNLTTTTTRYTGSTATQPFSRPSLSGWPPYWPPIVIAPGTSGWYQQSYIYSIPDTNATFTGPVVSYCVIVDGVIVYGPTTPVEQNAPPPPANTFQKGNFVGYSYSVFQPGGTTDYTFFTACYDFTYTRLNTSAITNVLFNGENGQDIVGGYGGYTLGGGGGGGGGGARGGNGGAAVSGTNGVATGNGITGGYSGYNGLSLGETTVASTGRLPYVNNFYPGGGVAAGGTKGTASNGGNGAVVFDYQTGGGATVNDNGTWKLVSDIYVKDNGSWQPVIATYINDNGTWRPIKGAVPPTFTPVNAAFGAVVRPYSAGALLAPPPPAPDYGSGGFTGYGSSDMF